ncbi:MAG: chromosomal replication initiator protein DnaA [Alistipes sp.]|nr:chromosomal replication initiator protein DnaA [Candidatus Alistipes equi]
MQTGDISYNDAWQSCLSQIRNQTSPEEFNKWFLPIVPIEYDGTRLRLRVPDREFVRKIESSYITVLRPLIAKMFGKDTALSYAVPKSDSIYQDKTYMENTAYRIGNPTASDINKSNPYIIPGIKKVCINPNLNPNYCFSNFIEGECNRLARSASMSVAITPGNKTPFNPLYIYGDSGLGKTHVAQAIGNEILQRHPELQVLYVPMNIFQTQYQSANINKEVPDFIHFYQSVDVLILDDIQELAGKPGTQNAFFNIFNHLQMTGKQLVLISDKPPVELQDISERLLTRFKWGLSACIKAPDMETKVKIIRAKAAQRKVEIPDDVTYYLADHINENVREIEGAVASLIAHTSFCNRKISITLAKEVLKVYVLPFQKEITIDHIIDIVCEHMNVTVEQLKSEDRRREIAIARQLAMYLAKGHTKAPLVSIGAAIGNRNHATVLHSCKTIQNLMDTDSIFKAQVEEIEKFVLR